MAKTDQQGIALILVLWVAALLTVIAVSFAYAARTDMTVLGNQAARARAEAAADAGVERAVYEAMRPITNAGRWKQDGREYSFQLGEALIRVRVKDESGKIDINTAAPALLKGLFLSVGVDDTKATQLVDAIQDWIDPDSASRLNGAEEEAYRAANLKILPANAPFQLIEELRLVYGMTPEVYGRISDLITIYSRQPGVNLTIASREVLLALPGISAEQVDNFIARRQNAADNNLPIPLFVEAAAFGAVPNLIGLEVRSEAVVGEAVFERMAIIKVLPDPRRPYSVLVWKEGRSREDMNAKGRTDER